MQSIHPQSQLAQMVVGLRPDNLGSGVPPVIEQNILGGHGSEAGHETNQMDGVTPHFLFLYRDIPQKRNPFWGVKWWLTTVVSILNIYRVSSKERPCTDRMF